MASSFAPSYNVSLVYPPRANTTPHIHLHIHTKILHNLESNVMHWSMEPCHTCRLTRIVRNILKCIGKHSFSYERKRMRMLSKHSYVFFYTFYLNFLTSKNFYLTINNEYRSLVFTILWGCLLYSNDWNIIECECTYGTYGSQYILWFIACEIK